MTENTVAVTTGSPKHPSTHQGTSMASDVTFTTWSYLSTLQYTGVTFSNLNLSHTNATFPVLHEFSTIKFLDPPRLKMRLCKYTNTFELHVI